MRPDFRCWSSITAVSGPAAGKRRKRAFPRTAGPLLAFAKDSLGDPKLIVYAYSLGSLVGCDLLKNGGYPQTVRLVLEAPIGSIQTLVENSSFLDLPGSFLTTYTGDNIERIGSIRLPLLWIHGTLDETVDRETNGLPIWNRHDGEGLFIKTIGGTHTTNTQVIGYRRYIESIQAFCHNQAATTYPLLFTGSSTLEWGEKTGFLSP